MPHLTWTKPEHGLSEGAYQLPDGTCRAAYRIARNINAGGTSKRWQLWQREGTSWTTRAYFRTLPQAKTDADRRQAIRERSPTFPPLLPAPDIDHYRRWVAMHLTGTGRYSAKAAYAAADPDAERCTLVRSCYIAGITAKWCARYMLGVGER